MKRRYQLRDNSVTEGPTSHIFLSTRGTFAERDGETRCGVDEIAAIAATHVRLESGRVHSRDDFVGPVCPFAEWLDDRISAVDRTTWIWCYQMGRTYQRLGMFSAQESGDFVCCFAVYGASTFIAKGKLRGVSVVFLDTQNWIRQSPQEILSALGDQSGLYVRGSLTDDSQPNQCRAECDIIGYAVRELLRWHREADIGCLRYTVSAQSLQLWRHQLGPRVPEDRLTGRQSDVVRGSGRNYVYPIVHSSEQALRAERAAYYGPTNTVYRSGRVAGPIYQLDVQSAYPSIMGDNHYPFSLVGRVERPTVERLGQLADEYGVIALVKLETPIVEFPCRIGKKTVSVCGNFWTVLPGPELSIALDSGLVNACECCYLYETGPIFVAWKDWTCTEKDRLKSIGNNVLCGIVKNLGNTLHGKFGQRTAAWEPVPGELSDEPWGTEIYQPADGSRPRLRRSVAYKIEQQGDREEHPQSYPAISAWVNSYMRLHMKRLRQLAGERHCYYVYTDCLHVDETGWMRLAAADEIEPGAHGKLRLEAVHDWCHYYAPGRYETEKGLNCAGLSDEHWRDGSGTIHQLVYTGPDEHITSALVGGKPIVGVLAHEVEYRLTETAGGRSVDADGWTSPKILTEE